MMKKCLLVLLVCSAMAMAASVPAGWSSNDYYTYQNWSMDTGANPMFADAGYINPSNPNLTVHDTDSIYWNGDSAWILEGPASSDPSNPMVSIFIPNTLDETRVKEVWINILFQVNADFAERFYIWPTTQGGENVQLVDQQVLDVNPAAGIYEAVALFTIDPQPSCETIVVGLTDIFQGEMLVIDNITVATQCIPEPATIGVLGLGTLLLMRRRRK